VTLATALVVMPVAVAMAFRVTVPTELSVIAPTYAVLDVEGVVESSV
jgi:hypothetical protein